MASLRTAEPSGSARPGGPVRERAARADGRDRRGEPISGQAPTGRYALSAWLTLRLIGATALSGFVSLHVQVIGLFGAEGILPLAPRLERLRDVLGDDAWTTRPTLLLLTGAGDDALLGLCVAGELAALALMLGVLPGPSVLVSAAIYLSFVNVGSPFLPLQWDTLLLESLWLGALIAPWRATLVPPWRAQEPPHVARWAMWLLVARLLLASGLVKWIGDDVWRDLSALTFHYETQPLPTPLSPWAHAMPGSFHALGALFTFFVELAPVPFLVFGPRRARHVAATCILVLQGIIALTGNYGFFNLLTASLCVSLFDDAALRRVLPARWSAPGVLPLKRSQIVVPSLLASVLVVLQLAQFATSLGAPARDELTALLDATQPLSLTSSYGLFANMTTERPELVIEGTVDGEHWVPYRFRWKPDDPARGLAFTGPHMPRMDWMLWFAALGPPEHAPWMRSLLQGLLERRAPVLELFAGDPFDGEAPRAVRVTRWDYRFAPPGGDATWVRDDETPFMSPRRAMLENR